MKSENYEISVKKTEEAGYYSAMVGLALNMKQPIDNMPERGKKLSGHDYGHNKFLEHLEVWMLVRAPLRWWKQADTYRIASKNSESSMHTIMNHFLSRDAFEKGLRFKIKNPLLRIMVSIFIPIYLMFINILIFTKQFDLVTIFLADSFLQTRMWKMSYKTLRNIIIQRYNHKLSHWRHFCDSILSQIDHPEFLLDVKKFKNN